MGDWCVGSRVAAMKGFIAGFDGRLSSSNGWNDKEAAKGYCCSDPDDFSCLL